MRSCRRADEVRAALAAEEPLNPELTRHARDCAECTATVAHARRFERSLQRAVNQIITDGLPPDTLSAARLGGVPGRMPAAQRLVLSGWSATAIVLLAAVGVAATGVGVVGAVSGLRLLAPDPNVVQSEFTTCYVEEATALNPDGDRQPFSVTVESCLADAAETLDMADYMIVVGLNRRAADTTACLRSRGWDVEPVLEPGGRFLVPPVSAPAVGDPHVYMGDMEACTEEQR